MRRGTPWLSLWVRSMGVAMGGWRREPKRCNGCEAYGLREVHRAVAREARSAEPEVGRVCAGVPSGSQPKCVSDYGVYDMPGNADELASSETFGARSEFDSVTT